jgi:hypothetical protein
MGHGPPKRFCTERRTKRLFINQANVPADFVPLMVG